jgi:DNA-binding HxlR family transcriptional regulator
MEDGTLQSLGHICDTDPDTAADIRRILDLIGDKWSLLVMKSLGDATVRFMDLRRAIPGISQRMLTLTLRQLERDGLVVRTVYPTIPPKVEYRVTDLGMTLQESILGLISWAYQNQSRISEARVRYDLTQAKLASLAAD